MGSTQLGALSFQSISHQCCNRVKHLNCLINSQGDSVFHSRDLGFTDLFSLMLDTSTLMEIVYLF